MSNIEEMIVLDKDALLTHAMQHPGLAPKRKPTVEIAAKVIINDIEKTFKEQVQANIEPQLEELVGAYKLANGERDEATDADEWDSGLDDQFENLLEPWATWLSADWLGRYTVDSGLHEENATAKMAAKVANEVWKQTISGKSVMQQLSSAGIVTSDIELYMDMALQQSGTATETPTETETVLPENQTELDDVLAIVKRTVGDAFDQMEVFGDLELALDEDELLANGAGERLGLDSEMVRVLSVVMQDYDDASSAAEYLLGRLDEITAAPAEEEKAPAPAKAAPKAPPAPARAAPPAPGAAKAPPPPPGKPAAPKIETGKPAPAAKPAAKGKAKDSEANALNDVMVLFKENASAWSDTKMAEDLGVSRGTLSNWTTRKSACTLDEDQTGTVRTKLVASINGLMAALGALDGVEYDTVG